MGAERFLSTELLQQWLVGHNLQLVLFSGNISHTLAKVFVDAGVPWVCSIDGELDPSTRFEFARTLCESLLQGNPVEAAFKAALQHEHIQMQTQPSAAQLEQRLFAGAPDGLLVECVDSSLTKIVKNIPRPRPLVAERLLDVDRLLQSFWATPPPFFCSVYGVRGVGKSNLGLAVAHYMSDRRLVDHVVWIDMSAFETVKLANPKTTFTAYVAQQVNPTWRDILIPSALCTQISGLDYTLHRPKQFLLVIDGVIDSAPIASVLVTIMQSCSNVRVLIVFLFFFGSLFSSTFAPKILSVHLFLCLLVTVDGH